MSDKKTVLLFFPSPMPYERNWKGAPLALLAISRLLDQQGYQVKIFARYLQKDYQNQILKLGSHSLCLGISAMTGFQIKDGLKTARLFKKKYPHIPIVWGGWHPSILPRQTLKNPNVDIVVTGQGDETFPKLVETIKKNKSFKKIPGIYYKKNGQILSTTPSVPVDLSKLPPLPYHLVDLKKCTQSTEYGLNTAQYISSYGCPHRCAFCVEQIVNKRRWVAVPSKTVVDEWENLVKNHQVDSIAVYDSNFFVDQSRVREICQELLRRKLNLKWGNANGRVGQLSQYQPQTWRLMEKSGCAMILTGAESGSQAALDFISKDMNVDQIIKFTKLCAKYHIKILYSFLVGLPWSKNPTENNQFVAAEYQSTLQLIDKLLKICNRNRYTYYVFLPYPGAPLYHRARSLGLKVPNSLSGWSNYLMSPENAFQLTIRQKWISQQDAYLTAMLTQYIFGIMDRDTYTMLLPRLNNLFSKTIFTLGYYVALMIVSLRWKFKFFRIPIDYWFFTQIHRYAGIV